MSTTDTTTTTNLRFAECLDAMLRSFTLHRELDTALDWDRLSDEDFECLSAHLDQEAELERFSAEERRQAFMCVLESAGVRRVSGSLSELK